MGTSGIVTRSVSGIRASHDAVHPDLFVWATAAFLQEYVLSLECDPSTGRRTVVLGRDSRISGGWASSVVEGTLMSFGVDCISIGIVPTPTVQVLVQKYGAQGGIVLTASHNPIEYNGLKFIGGDGLFLRPTQAQAVCDASERAPQFEATLVPGRTRVVPTEEALDEHLKLVFDLPYINVGAIREEHIKVVVDTVNGAGGPMMVRVLQRLGCSVVELHTEPTGRFAHGAEPLPENLGGLCEAVVLHQADVGMAVDPDCDRFVVVDEKGQFVGEEYSLAFAVYAVLTHVVPSLPDAESVPKVVVKNMSTTAAVDEIARGLGFTTKLTPVGEIHVAEGMIETGAIVGGEGGGGVMLRDVHLGRDAPAAAVLLLQLLAWEKKSVSAIKAMLPCYEIVKHKMALPLQGTDTDAMKKAMAVANSALAAIASEYSDKGHAVTCGDGVRIDCISEGWWVHLRRSNTEPILRIIGEHRGGKAAGDAMCTKFSEILRERVHQELGG